MKIEHGMPQKVLLPSEGETIAIAAKDKTAALCYDRILVPYLHPLAKGGIPDSIRCCGESLFEKEFIKLCECGKRLEEIKGRPVTNEELMSAAKGLLGYITFLSRGIASNSSVLDLFLGATRECAKSFSETYGIPVAVICTSEKERDNLYKEGDRKVVVSILSDLEIVDEGKLTWQQVIEFRKDKKSLQKYRRLLHWLDKEMVGKSQAFIEDDIVQKLEDYESALEKHGLKTVLGTIEEVLDGKYLLGASGIVGSFSIAGYPGLGVLAGAGLMVGKMAVKLGQIWLDFNDAERGANSEISWVYEVKEQFRK
jgi:hypothetical protein